MIYLKDLLDELLDALFVIDSADHLDANLGYFVEVGAFQTHVLHDLDDTLADADTSVLDTWREYVMSN